MYVQYLPTGVSTFAHTSFQRRLPLLKTPEETTWLYHELGRCQMELGDHTAAREMGEKSLEAAREAQDQMWQLNASVLVAQAESEFSLPPSLPPSLPLSLSLSLSLTHTHTHTHTHKSTRLGTTHCIA